ncbi:MAG: type I pullulanase [Firmicutes bacterium]|nr:type I pullulanase [Bacillota bacterium]
MISGYGDIGFSGVMAAPPRDDHKNCTLEIKTSGNTLTPGAKIFFAAFVKHPDGKTENVEPSWKIEAEKQGVSINREGVLSGSFLMKANPGETIKITSSWHNLKGEKIIKIAGSTDLPGLHRVHFFRFDNDYRGWNIWNWGNIPAARQVNFAEKTDFGVMAVVEGKNAIIRLGDWQAKATGDLGLDGKSDVFIVEGDSKEYVNFREALAAARPRVFAAMMDSPDRVRVYLSNSPSAPEKFELTADGVPIAYVTVKDRVFNINIDPNYHLDPSALFEVRSFGAYSPGKVTLRRVLDNFYYSGNDMGVTFTENKINLRLWAPTARNVSVMIYDSWNSGDESGREIPMHRSPAADGTWTISLDKHSFYGKLFKYRLIFNPGTSYEKITYAVDPYAYAITANGRKAALVDIKSDSAALPENWKPSQKPAFKSPVDAILYELHVRDFSTDHNSGVKPEFRGKYLAFTQTGTTLKGNPKVKTGIDHLAELGITHLHLLPVYDFASVDETKLSDPSANHYNWGYDPQNYNAPEGSYSTDPFNPACRVNEFRRMVQALHDKNIRVVMDVVYNHTMDNSAFDPIVPGYYYRSDDLGRYSNGSGCGNEVASERPMVRKFIIDSVKHWAEDYSIDGFRFDLMGIIDRQTMVMLTDELHRMDPSIIVYGEPWGGGWSTLHGDMQTVKGSQRGQAFSVFNDNIRNSIRGNNDAPHPAHGFVTGKLADAGQVLKGIIGSVTDFTCKPSETINYVSCHDNFCIWDQIIASLGHDFPHDPYVAMRNDDIKKDEMADSRVKRAVLANAIVLTSQGIAFIHAGEEILRTKYGCHNSYNAGDEINMIRWNWKENYYDVFRYYQGLIKLRREHPAFRMNSEMDIRKHFSLLECHGKMIAYALTVHANGDHWKHIIVVINPYTTAHEFHLPRGKWHIVVNHREAGTTPVKTGDSKAEGKVRVQGISMMVLYQ